MDDTYGKSEELHAKPQFNKIEEYLKKCQEYDSKGSVTFQGIQI